LRPVVVLSDGAQSLTLEAFRELAGEVAAVAAAVGRRMNES
jgi:3-deoxy-D-arabino-heptulosonate 7-phosphate (DAHP) synthase